MTVVGVAVATIGAHAGSPDDSGTPGAGRTVSTARPATNPAARPVQQRARPVPRAARSVRPDHPTGVLHVVARTGPVVGHGPLQTYQVAIEGGVRVDHRAFARSVQQTLADRRGWGHVWSFREVADEPASFTVVLASPHKTNQLCLPSHTHGRLSCFNDGRAVVNVWRWRAGARTYGFKRHLTAYRHYVVSHEVGHALGNGHLYSCRPDGRAPTMMQQTRSLYGCTRNAWPYP